ncbi:hypothetical protein FHS70_001335 [Flammeovirga yaeyamensis]|nr:hypothetical protein [Flammeovirga yaeyamensis]
MKIIILLAVFTISLIIKHNYQWKVLSKEDKYYSQFSSYESYKEKNFNNPMDIMLTMINLIMPKIYFDNKSKVKMIITLTTLIYIISLIILLQEFSDFNIK